MRCMRSRRVLWLTFDAPSCPLAVSVRAVLCHSAGCVDYRVDPTTFSWSDRDPGSATELYILASTMRPSLPLIIGVTTRNGNDPSDYLITAASSNNIITVQNGVPLASAFVCAGAARQRRADVTVSRVLCPMHDVMCRPCWVGHVSFLHVRGVASQQGHHHLCGSHWGRGGCVCIGLASATHVIDGLLVDL